MKGLMKLRCYVSVLIVAGLLAGCGGGSSKNENPGDEEEVQNTNDVKSVFINTDLNNSWVMTAVDQNDLFYSFFAEKDIEGGVEYYKQLVLEKKDAQNDFSQYLTMDFDELGRPIEMDMHESKGKIKLDYTSDSQISVTIQMDDGRSEILQVANPYTDSSSRYAFQSNSIPLDDIELLDRSYSVEDSWFASGDIIGCNDNEKPAVTIKRILPKEMLDAQPQLAILKPSLRAPDEYLSNHIYSYELPGLENYESWYLSCIWNYTGGLVTGFVTERAGQAVGIIEKLYQFGNSIINDIDEKTNDQTTNYVVDTTGDAILPAWSFLRKLKAMGKLPIDNENGPCSAKIYDYLNQIQTAEEEVKVTLNSTTKKASFYPNPRWDNELSEWLVEAPSFDFSDSCTNSEAKFFKPTKAICSSKGGTWYTGPFDLDNECIADWDTAMSICELPTVLQWRTEISDCGGIATSTYSDCITSQGYATAEFYWTSEPYFSEYAHFADLRTAYLGQTPKTSENFVRCSK